MRGFAPISKAWQFDRLGNWMKVLSDADPSGNWGAEEDRTHNKVNELTSRSPDSGPTLNLTFDWAGNIKSQKVQGTSGTVTISYTHDAWNRLARVKYDGVLRSEFRYNALHHRVMKTADVRSAGGAGGPNTDTPPDGTIDQRRLLFYDASWRMIEERIDDTFTLTGGGGGSFVEDRRVQYFWGIRGTDDIVLHRVNNNPSGSAGGSYDKNFYHLTDTQFSTLVIVDQHAKEIERISYDAYGRPRHHPLGDLDGDGMVRADEHQLMFSLGAGTVADLNRDGVVNGDDRALMGANLSISLAPGVLSLAAVDNQLGYAGYIYHAEMRTYLARHRWFDPELGRWLQRDPAGYVDGMNLYLYGLGSPFVFVDPWGLFVDLCATPWSVFWQTVYERSIGPVVDLAVDNGKLVYGTVTGDMNMVMETDTGQRMLKAASESDGVIEAMARYSVDRVVDTVTGVASHVADTAKGIAAGDIEAIGDGLMFAGGAGLGVFGPAAVSQRMMSLAGKVKPLNPTGTAVTKRLPQDVAVTGRAAPEPRRLDRPVGQSSAQNAAAQSDIAALQRIRGVQDIRVNQRQLNGAGVQVGINRSDVSYMLGGRRFHIEYDRAGSPRGIMHLQRIMTNDPYASVLLRTVD